MRGFEMKRLPTGLNGLLQRIENVRNRLTHLSSARGIHTQKFNTTIYRLSYLRYTCTKSLNSLENGPPFNNVTNRKHFKVHFPIWPFNLIRQISASPK